MSELNHEKYVKSLYENFNLNQNYLTERSIKSEGNRKEYDNTVQYFFPMIWNKFRGNIEMIIPLMIPRDSTEEKIQQQRIKNIKLEIRVSALPTRGAWTYPSLTGTSSITALQYIPFVGPLVYTMNAYTFLSKNSNILEKAKNKNGAVVFPSQLSNLKVQVFLTRGLMQVLKEEERTAVILHEIGHWVHLSPIVYRMGLILASPFLTFLVPVILIAMIILGRTAEWEADAFAKELGYGQQLANALENITINTRKDATILLKLEDYLTKFFTHLHNVIDIILPLSTHPSVTKRTKTLRDSEEYLLPLTESDILMLNGLLSESFIKEKVMALLKPICNEFDKKISKILPLISPSVK